MQKVTAASLALFGSVHVKINSNRFKSNCQSASQPPSQSVSQPVSQAVSQSATQPASQSGSHSVSQSASLPYTAVRKASVTRLCGRLPHTAVRKASVRKASVRDCTEGFRTQLYGRRGEGWGGVGRGACPVAVAPTPLSCSMVCSMAAEAPFARQPASHSVSCCGSVSQSVSQSVTQSASQPVS